MNPIRHLIAILAALVCPPSTVKSKFLSVMVIAAAFVFHTLSANAAIVVNTPGTYHYGWSPWDNTPDWAVAASYTPNVGYFKDAGGACLLVNDANVGTVTWQFQAASGLKFQSDMAVGNRESFWGTGFIEGRWSSDGTNYTPFLYYDSGDHYAPVSLSASGYTGSQNLYVQFAMQNTSGTPTLVQLFRLHVPGDMFSVDGTVIAVPEPASISLIGLALGTLLMRRQTAKNRPVR